MSTIANMGLDCKKFYIDDVNGWSEKSFKSFKRPYSTGRDYIRGNSGKNLSLQRVKWQIRTVKVHLIGVNLVKENIFSWYLNVYEHILFYTQGSQL